MKHTISLKKCLKTYFFFQKSRKNTISQGINVIMSQRHLRAMMLQKPDQKNLCDVIYVNPFHNSFNL